MVFLHNPEREKEQNKISLRTKAGLVAEWLEHGPVYSQGVLWERTPQITGCEKTQSKAARLFTVRVNLHCYVKHLNQSIN
jgi:hypothetical protein